MISERRVITLPAGYNGDTMQFYADPIVTDGNVVKLQCAVSGKEYLIRWAYKTQVELASSQSGQVS